MELGEIRRNSFGTEMKIVEIKCHNNIIIEFVDEQKYRKHTTYNNYKSGNIKNPFDKNICGVGYIGDGKYRCKYSSGIHTPEYQNWICMIRRCYDFKRKGKYPSYYGNCTVCREWHNFQNFAEWYSKHYYEVGTERMHLDKDILYPGNKLYSPETCLIVPQGINMLFLNKTNKRGLPNGITQNSKGLYRAKYNEEELGEFETLDEAYKKYTGSKKSHILRVLEKYKSKIPEKVYRAVLEYEFDIRFDRNYAN